MEERSFYLPDQFLINAKVHKSTIRQLSAAAQKITQTVEAGSEVAEANVDGRSIKTIKPKQPLPEGTHQILQTSTGLLPATTAQAKEKKTKWLAPVAELITQNANPLATRQSWRGQFFFREEETEGNKIVQTGLRPPQTGALHAALAHWKVSEQPATIVMPTGTGKTETMLALLIQQRLPRLLVVVPNLALRAQIERKFLTLGLLKPLGVVGSQALLPIVTCLSKQLTSAEEMEATISPSNVIIANIQVLQGCTPVALQKLEELCSHLFVDEAHHLPATKSLS